MKQDSRVTRAYLKRLSPNQAEAYLKSFNLPIINYKVMYYLYVKKIPDIVQVKYKLEEDKVFISFFKAGELHRQSIEWICDELKNN